MAVEVLHVIQRVSRGGASAALTALVGADARDRHRVVSLVASEPDARSALTLAGAAVTDAPASAGLDELAAAADIVQVHFWNTPELYGFLTRPRRARILVWSHVAGSSVPHVLIPALAADADLLVGTAPLPDPARTIRPASPRSIRATVRDHRGPLTVGLFGTLAASRTDRRAVDVIAAAGIADAGLLVVGDGDLRPRWQRDAARLGLRARFTGWVADVAGPLADMDVLVHLPRPGGFATADLALQEAMAAGVVPVVLAGTAVAGLVTHGHDGLVARDLSDCAALLAELDADRGLVARLSRAAAARESNAASCAAAFQQAYDELMQRPAGDHELPLPPAGSDRFVATLGEHGQAFRTSAARAPGWQDADEAIAGAGPALAAAGAGGILHWRGAYPDDAMLRWWAGLVFERAGRRAFAAAEYAAAATAGIAGAADRLSALIGPGGSRPDGNEPAGLASRSPATPGSGAAGRVDDGPNRSPSAWSRRAGAR